MKIPFKSKGEILKLAEAYEKGAKSGKKGEERWAREEDLEGWKKVGKGRRFIIHDELITLIEWKAVRVIGRVKENSEEDVKLASRLAFQDDLQGAWKLGVLSLLYGVRWPVASCILHFAYDGDYSGGKTPKHGGYPILDVRAMDAVGGDQNYTPEKWDEYVNICRKAAKRYQVSMRTLDRALWEYGRRLSRP